MLDPIPHNQPPCIHFFFFLFYIFHFHPPTFISFYSSSWPRMKCDKEYWITGNEIIVGEGGVQRHNWDVYKFPGCYERGWYLSENRVICNNSEITGPPGQANHQLQPSLIHSTKSLVFGLYHPHTMGPILTFIFLLSIYYYCPFTLVEGIIIIRS